MLQTAVDPPPSVSRELGRTVGVALVGLALGVLTAYAQGWLSGDLNSLANSAGPWSLVAFGLAMLVGGPRLAALSGVLVLSLLELGYVLGSNLKGHPSATSTVAFWLLAALIAGPALGLGGHWARAGRPGLAAFGTGCMSGVLVGEGLYGLRVLEVPRYSWGEIACGVALFVVLSLRRFPSWRPVLLAVTVAAIVGGTFVTTFGRVLL